ncbi:hypothetical protein FP828_09210 [bacterium]|nr:hypothetical protein [bacterium]
MLSYAGVCSRREELCFIKGNSGLENMNKHSVLFDGKQWRRRGRPYAKVFAAAAFLCVFAGRVFPGALDISFSAANYTAYYDAAASSLTWNSALGYLHLPYGIQKNVFSTKYPTMSPVAPQKPTAQMGCSLVVADDCYVSGFARWAGSNGGNPSVRLWTDDTEEYAGGITYPWVDMGVGNTSGWVEGIIDFSEELYPLTAGNIYWLANVADGDPAHQVGDAGAATSGCPYVSVAEVGGQAQLWYINNEWTAPGSAANPSENLQVIPQHLYGVPDLRLNRFDAAGSLITKTIDLGASKVKLNDFLPVFYTANSKIGFDAVSKTDVMAYSIDYKMISALGRTPQCAAAFSIAQSSDGVNFGNYETVFAGTINKRYIKIKMELTTAHRGITPIVDSVSIPYNCYPEPINASSVEPAEGALVTEKSPVFRWSPSYDNDGDTVTYTLSISSTPSFATLIFSTQTLSVPSSTYVAVNCPVELTDRTSYFFRIDAIDSNEAETSYDRTFSFKTELVPLNLTDSGIINGSRVLASYVQNGFVLQFSKDIDFGTFPAAFTFTDYLSAEVLYDLFPLSSSCVQVIPKDNAIEPCRSYHFSVGATLKDTIGLYITDGVIVDFGTLNSKADAYTASVAGSSIIISAGASPEDFYVNPQNLVISSSTNSDLFDANQSANSSAFLIVVSTSSVFSYSISNSVAAEISSLSGITLIVPYNQDSLTVPTGTSFAARAAGRSVLPGGLSARPERTSQSSASGENITVPPALLRVFRLNESSSQWGLVPGEQSVDAVSKTVTAYPTSGGTFALLAYPSNPAANVQLRNIPNPFYPESVTSKGEKGTLITYYLSAAANVKAKIYTQIGHLIYEKEYTSGGLGGQASVNSITWDGKNKDGAYVASGIYLLRLEIEGEEARTRKIGFIR